MMVITVAVMATTTSDTANAVMATTRGATVNTVPAAKVRVAAPLPPPATTIAADFRKFHVSIVSLYMHFIGVSLSCCMQRLTLCQMLPTDLLPELPSSADP